MKKVVLLLSVVAAIALASCGNKQAEAPQAPETEVIIETEASDIDIEIEEGEAEEAPEAEAAE